MLKVCSENSSRTTKVPAVTLIDAGTQFSSGTLCLRRFAYNVTVHHVREIKTDTSNEKKIVD
jgi:hypothetical protein